VTSRTVRWLVLAGAVMATSFAAMRLLRSSAPEVAVARVQFGELETWITTNGVVEPREPYVIRAPVGAFVSAVQNVEGRKVRRGDSLLALDVAAQRADLARAREELVKAQNAALVLQVGPAGGEWAQVTSDFRKADAEVLQLQRAKDATERLVAKQAANRDELDRAELALTRALVTRDALARRQQELERMGPVNADAARLAIERARETVSLLDAQVRSADVRAPIEGTVYSLPVRVGNRVETGTTLAQVADLRAVQIRVFVDEPELAAIREGLPVEVSWSAESNRVWMGRTERVPKNVVPRGDRMVGEVICTVKNDDEQLVPNLGVDVRIRLQARPRALLVPRQAVRSDQGGRYVFVMKDRTAARRPIVVDGASATSYAVARGLEEGDLVVLPGDVELRDAMRVRTRSEVE
jgi:HlyD family secretion protein